MRLTGDEIAYPTFLDPLANGEDLTGELMS
jgi:hypothetical protein